MITTNSALNCLPREGWGSAEPPVRASFDGIYPADLRARNLRDWKTGCRANVVRRAGDSVWPPVDGRGIVICFPMLEILRWQ